MLNELRVCIAQIPPSGFSLDTEISSEIFFGDFVDDRFKTLSPIKVDLKIKQLGTTLLVTGQIATQIDCDCDYCLTSFALPIENRKVCLYFEELDDFIDLTSELREDLLINLPDQLVCDTDCQGLCPQCGINLNTESCSCSAPDWDEKFPTESQNVWDQLNSLDFD